MKIPDTMKAVLLTGNGDFDKLVFTDGVPTPQPKLDDVLIKVAAAAINNTDINTRIGWYSEDLTSDKSTNDNGKKEASTWSGAPMNFPLIQGGDCCGHIVAVGRNVRPSRIGERVIVRNVLKSPVGYRPWECVVFGSETDGAFAQYAVAPSSETDKVSCDWSDEELACIPIAYTTAECMLDRADVGKERVLITGASGGVGSAAVQLAKRRGATVIAISAKEKFDAILNIGADKVLDRDTDLVEELGKDSVDVVVDLVAGPNWPKIPEILVRGGRYVVAGAIGGAVVKFDVRNLYLKDQSFFGVTYRKDSISEDVIKYIERGEIRPLISKTYPLENIVQAQRDFISKKFPGKLVLIPPKE